MPQSLGFAALILVTLIWGTTFVVIKDVLGSVSVPVLLALRFSLAGLLLVWVRPKTKSLRAGLILGVLIFLGYATQSIGLVTTTASKSGFITGLSVILTPLLAGLWLRERVTTKIIVACLVALAGLGFLSIRGEGAFGGLNSGDVWTLGTAFAYALYIIYLGEVARHHGIWELSALQIWLVALFAWVWAAPDLSAVTQIDLSSFLKIAYLAVFPTVVTSALQTWGQRSVSASVAALIFVLEPVFAATFAYIILGESLGPVGLVGAGLVVSAMVLSQLRLGPRPTTVHHQQAD